MVRIGFKKRGVGIKYNMIGITCHHDGPNIGFIQFSNGGSRSRLQFVLHYQETSEFQIALHYIPTDMPEDKIRIEFKYTKFCSQQLLTKTSKFQIALYYIFTDMPEDKK